MDDIEGKALQEPRDRFSAAEEDHSLCVSWDFCFEDLNCQGDPVILEEKFCGDCDSYRPIKL